MDQASSPLLAGYAHGYGIVEKHPTSQQNPFSILHQSVIGRIAAVPMEWWQVGTWLREPLTLAPYRQSSRALTEAHALDHLATVHGDTYDVRA